MRALILLLALAYLPAAAGTCPWLNAATAGGFLGGTATNIAIKRAGTGGSCTFTRQAGSTVQELRIDVEPLSAMGHCPPDAVTLRGVGNEARTCSEDGGGRMLEKVVGRVRDQAFTVRFSTTDISASRSKLRDKIAQIAEQVAGILF